MRRAVFSFVMEQTSFSLTVSCRAEVDKKGKPIRSREFTNYVTNTELS